MVWERVASRFLGCHARKFGSRRCFSTTGTKQWIADKEKVGFIGLGNMGGGMAKNLCQKGHDVVAYDVCQDAVCIPLRKGLGEHADKLVQVATPAEVAAQTRILVTMLPNNAVVREVFTGKDGVFETVQQGALLIDSSTIDPSVSQAMAAAASDKDATFVDAPVSGGVLAANAGTLTFMVGANEAADFEKAKNLLLDMGKNVTHCGKVGSGGAVKICNNMLLAISMIGVSETMNLGINLGVDPKLLTSILSSATGRCWSVDTYNPVPGVMPNVPSSKNYEGGFGAQLMLKDLGLAQDAATRTSTATPLGSSALHIYRLMCNSGEFANKDFSSAFQFLSKEENKYKDYEMVEDIPM